MQRETGQYLLFSGETRTHLKNWLKLLGTMATVLWVNRSSSHPGTWKCKQMWPTKGQQPGESRGRCCVFTVIHWKVLLELHHKKSDRVLVEAWIFHFPVQNALSVSHQRSRHLFPLSVESKKYAPTFRITRKYQRNIFPLRKNMNRWDIASVSMIAYFSLRACTSLAE